MLKIITVIKLNIRCIQVGNKAVDGAAHLFLGSVLKRLFNVGTIDLVFQIRNSQRIAPEPDRITGLILIDSLIAGDLEVFGDALKHMVLPASVLGLYGLAGIARIVRSSMLDVLSQEYIKTARIKGLNEFLVLTRHALRNALVPAVTVIGLTYGGLLEGSVLTETIFSWPGLGRYLAAAFLTLDLNAVVGGTMLVALTFCLVNLMVDLIYAFLNPRITLTES